MMEDGIESFNLPSGQWIVSDFRADSDVDVVQSFTFPSGQ
jgi:hypothetical protein